LFRKPTHVLPITPVIVQHLLYYVIGGDLDVHAHYDVSLHDWRTVAAAIFSFASLARYNCMSLLTVAHLRFADGGLYVTFPSSKTDQLGLGEEIFIMSTDSIYCPVAFMRKYLGRLDWESSLAQLGEVYAGPLFPALCQRRVLFEGDPYYVQLPLVLQPFSYTGALRAFRKLLAFIGIPDPKCYGLHSGRRGGATAALNAGCPLLFVKRQGRWKSDSVPLLYVDPDFANLCVFSRHLNL
jgi:hypothetical protein